MGEDPRRIEYSIIHYDERRGGILVISETVVSRSLAIEEHKVLPNSARPSVSVLERMDPGDRPMDPGPQQYRMYTTLSFFPHFFGENVEKSSDAPTRPDRLAFPSSFRRVPTSEVERASWLYLLPFRRKRRFRHIHSRRLVAILEATMLSSSEHPPSLSTNPIVVARSLPVTERQSPFGAEATPTGDVAALTRLQTRTGRDNVMRPCGGATTEGPRSECRS